MKTRNRYEGHAAGANELAARALQRRAVDAVIWGMPIVSMDAMRQAFFRDAGASYGDIVWWSASDWKNQLTTPNGATRYGYFNFNTKAGPVVLEVPAVVGAGLFGSLLDAWQVPLVDLGPKGADEGKGAKYLLLPPGYQGETPRGYVVVRSSTYNGYGALRAIPSAGSNADLSDAVALVQKLRLYPLAMAANPPEQRFIDMAGKLFDGVVQFDGTFFETLARVLNEEPVAARDLAIMGQLRTLGIERGKSFHADAALHGALRPALREAHAELMAAVAKIEPYWPGSRWGLPASSSSVGAKTGFTFQTADHLDVDARGMAYFLACAPPLRLGDASFYVMTVRAAFDKPLWGHDSFRLHVPPNVPAKQFWAATVYDRETCAFIRESPRIEVNSYQTDLQQNFDGSVDVDFGPKPRPGRESNWIHTAPNREWFAMFRFYGPGNAIFNKRWCLPDIEAL